MSFYKDVGSQQEHAVCRRCGHPFSSLLHVEDLIQVERALGYRYEVNENGIGHYQWICPPCRRANLALAQGRLWQEARGDRSTNAQNARPSMPSYVNPALSEGPLGEEDQKNFHP